jgi:hypothetical protein
MKISDLIVIDVLVAEFRESITPAILNMVNLLRSSKWDVFEAVANALMKLALMKLSEQGKVSNFLT